MFAAFLVLANRFIRPVIVAVLGRLVLRSLGLFVVVINALVLYIAALLAPQVVHLADPALLWLLVAAALYTILIALVGTLLGLNRPSTSGETEGVIWRVLESLPTPRRNALIENVRLEQVYRAIYATSIDVALAGTPVGRIRNWSEVHLLGDTPSPEARTPPERFRDLLQDLGPTYVKVGQMLASRRDLLPPEWVDELAKLQSEAQPFSWEDARATILAELGAEPEALFASIDHEPFAAASTAQVHRATTARRSASWRSRSSARGSWPRRRPTWASSRSSRASPSRASAWPARSAPGTSSASSRPGSCASSTTGTRPTTPAAWPTA